MTDLGSLGGSSSGLNFGGMSGGLNNRGQVIGLSSLAADSAACLKGDTANCHPFLWDGRKLIDLFTDTVGGDPMSATAINDAGDVVGTALFPNLDIPHAYLWKDGVAKDLGTLNGDCFSEAFAVNSRGQVVGQSFNCDTLIVRTFMWDNGTMIDLNAFVLAGSGLQLVEAVAINDRGEIAGDLVPPGCGGGFTPAQGNDAQCGHAFVLIPCDEDQDMEGCQDVPESTNAAAQSNPAPVTQISTNVSPGRLTPEMLAALRARFAPRHRGFGFGVPRF